MHQIKFETFQFDGHHFLHSLAVFGRNTEKMLEIRGCEETFIHSTQMLDLLPNERIVSVKVETGGTDDVAEV